VRLQPERLHRVGFLERNDPKATTEDPEHPYLTQAVVAKESHETLVFGLRSFNRDSPAAGLEPTLEVVRATGAYPLGRRLVLRHVPGSSGQTRGLPPARAALELRLQALQASKAITPG